MALLLGAGMTYAAMSTATTRTIDAVRLERDRALATLALAKQQTASLKDALASAQTAEGSDDDSAPAAMTDAGTETPSGGRGMRDPSPSSAQREKGTITAGLYVIGKDIPAGRYKGEVLNDGWLPYWKLSIDEEGQEIIANNLPTGTFYIDAERGQYLTLAGVAIRRVE